jgi:hypothetical protein
MNASELQISFSGATLRGNNHVCAFFNSDDEEYRTLLPFIREGFERGDRAFHILPRARQDHLERLKAAGIDVDELQKRGQLELRTAEDIYGDNFNKAERLITIAQELNDGRARGFARTRLIAHAECALAEWTRANEFVEYEARVNDVLRVYEDIVICTYNVHQFSSGLVLDVLRTHPLVIIGGILQDNPFYVPPEEFLRELQVRRSTAPERPI